MNEYNKAYYDGHISDLTASLDEVLEQGSVLKYLHDTKYGKDENKKRALAPMMFLVDMKYDEAYEWLEKAFKTFYENSAFDELRNTTGMTSIYKCMLVKAYRELIKEKRKAKADLTVTAEEMESRIISWLNKA